MYKGDVSVDDRGKLTFVNDFDFKNVKRFYMVENHEKGFVRAWHGHEKEGKYVFVVSGAIILGVVPILGTSSDLVNKTILSADKPSIVFIPPGNYNGFKTLTDDTKVIFYSTSTLEESKGDDIRMSADHYKSTWEVEQR